MQYPNRFPFDVLDPAPQYCSGCSCDFSRPDGRPETECRFPAECDCHEMWRESTDDLEKRRLWGDK